MEPVTEDLEEIKFSNLEIADRCVAERAYLPIISQ
jgi:hypothetical protein